MLLISLYFNQNKIQKVNLMSCTGWPNVRLIWTRRIQFIQKQMRSIIGEGSMWIKHNTHLQKKMTLLITLSIVSTFQIDTDITRFIMLGLKYYKRIGNNNDMWYAFYYNHFNQHLSSLKWIGVFIILVLSIEIFIYSFHKTILI